MYFLWVLIAGALKVHHGTQITGLNWTVSYKVLNFFERIFMEIRTSKVIAAYRDAYLTCAFYILLVFRVCIIVAF